MNETTLASLKKRTRICRGRVFFKAIFIDGLVGTSKNVGSMFCVQVIKCPLYRCGLEARDTHIYEMLIGTARAKCRARRARFRAMLVAIADRFTKPLSDNI
jgi:hypothetical protein